MGMKLALQGSDPVIRRVMLLNTATRIVHEFRFNEQAYAAGQILLNGSGSRRETVRNPVRKEDLAQGEGMLIIRKKDVISQV
jgi:hypothetical protein